MFKQLKEKIKDKKRGKDALKPASIKFEGNLFAKVIRVDGSEKDLGNTIQKFSLPAGQIHKGRNIQFQVVNTSSYNYEFKGFTVEYEEFRRA